MQFQDIVHLVRVRWKTLVVLTLVGVVVAGLAFYLTPKKYSATAGLYATIGGASDNASLASGVAYMTQRVTSYPLIVTTPAVLKPVISKLELPTSPAELANQIDASVPIETTWLEITVHDEDPKQASLIAEAVSEEFM